MGIVVALLLLALILGGVALVVTSLKWLLIVSLLLFVASFYSYRGQTRGS